MGQLLAKIYIKIMNNYVVVIDSDSGFRVYMGKYGHVDRLEQAELYSETQAKMYAQQYKNIEGIASAKICRVKLALIEN